jgi:ribosomal protein S18 acetylase RimI-like enzyme
MSIVVERALVASKELLEKLNRLIPQLSSNAPSLKMSELEELIESESATVFVAMDGDAIVGTLTLVVFQIPSGQRGWIEDVVVDESARGLGIGEALTVAAIDEARSRGVRSLDLTSRSSREAANALYLKLGFERRETNVYRFSIEN